MGIGEQIFNFYDKKLEELLILDSMNTVLIKQDPVMVGSHKDEPPDPEDFMLQDTLPLFENRLDLS